MKGVVILGEGELELRDYPDPEPGPDEIVISVKASGMCGTDLHMLNGARREGDAQIIAGHEPTGIVTAVGDAVLLQEAALGDRVMIHHYDGCRVCHYCRTGWTQMCPNGRTVYGVFDGHGAHAQYMKVPAHTAIRMPDALSFKAAAAISCGAGTAWGGVKRSGITGDDTVAIFGQGPVGLAATIFAKSFGARVIALDVMDERLEMARGFGADHTLNPKRCDPAEAIRALTVRGEGAQKSIECSSNPDARRQSIECLKRHGTACLVGVYGEITFDVSHVIQMQKTVLGSVTFSKNMMDDCAQYVVQRGIDLDALFTHEFRLDQAEEAYALFRQQKIGKGVFLFD